MWVEEGVLESWQKSIVFRDLEVYVEGGCI